MVLSLNKCLGNQCQTLEDVKEEHKKINPFNFRQINPVPAYVLLFQHVTENFCLFRPILAHSSQFQPFQALFYHLICSLNYFSIAAFHPFSISVLQHFRLSVFQHFSSSAYQHFIISAFKHFSFSAFHHSSISLFHRFSIGPRGTV